MEKRGGESTPNKSILSLEEIEEIKKENERLKRENESLKMENIYLKKLDALVRKEEQENGKKRK